MSERPSDGFCPRCKALEDEACHTADGRPVPDHLQRHPYPPAVPVGVQPEPAEGCACGADFLHGPHEDEPTHICERGHCSCDDHSPAAVPVVQPEPGGEVIHLAMHRGRFALVCVCEAAYAVVSLDLADVTCVRCLELQDQFESGAFV